MSEEYLNKDVQKKATLFISIYKMRKTDFRDREK